MTFNESTIRRVFVVAVLTISTSFAAASASTQAALPETSPTGVQAINSIPVSPFPSIPAGNKSVASAIPVSPFPSIPSGSRRLSA